MAMARAGTDVSERLTTRREACGLSIRGLAAASGVSPSLISKVEAGKVSPTVATLQKLMEALNTDFHEFFLGSAGREAAEQIVFRRESMIISKDADRAWRSAFPRHPVFKAQLTYEEYQPHTRALEKERHRSDLLGYVIAGELTLQVQGRGIVRAAAGDAFYIRAGQTHTTRNDGDAVLKLVAVQLR